MTKRPVPGVHEYFASIVKPSFGLDHGDKLVASHPATLRDASLADECHKPDAAADLHGEVGSLEHAGSPFAGKKTADDRADLLTEVPVVGRVATPPPQSRLKAHSVTADVAAARGVTVKVVGKIHVEHILGDRDDVSKGGRDGDGGDVIAPIVADLDRSEAQVYPGRYVLCNDVSNGTAGLIACRLEIFEDTAFGIPHQLVQLSQMEEVLRHRVVSRLTSAEPRLEVEGSGAEACTPISKIGDGGVLRRRQFFDTNAGRAMVQPALQSMLEVFHLVWLGGRLLTGVSRTALVLPGGLGSGLSSLLLILLRILVSIGHVEPPSRVTRPIPNRPPQFSFRGRPKKSGGVLQ